MDVSKKIKVLLVECELTATELAKKIGISQSYFSKKMRNNDWSAADLEKIAAALEVDLELNFVLKNGEKI